LRKRPSGHGRKARRASSAPMPACHPTASPAVAIRGKGGWLSYTCKTRAPGAHGGRIARHPAATAASARRMRAAPSAVEPVPRRTVQRR
jgi:hypothetical protein